MSSRHVLAIDALETQLVITTTALQEGGIGDRSCPRTAGAASARHCAKGLDLFPSSFSGLRKTLHITLSKSDASPETIRDQSIGYWDMAIHPSESCRTTIRSGRLCSSLIRSIVPTHSRPLALFSRPSGSATGPRNRDRAFGGFAQLADKPRDPVRPSILGGSREDIYIIKQFALANASQCTDTSGYCPSQLWRWDAA